MKRALAVTVLLIGITAGCRQAPQVVLGKAPAADPIIPVASISYTSHRPQTIRGTMVEKCPIAGCWFRVKDASGIVKVDTRSAGFVVTDVPLNSEVVVTGVPHTGGETTIAATGMSY